MNLEEPEEADLLPHLPHIHVLKDTGDLGQGPDADLVHVVLVGQDPLIVDILPPQMMKKLEMIKWKWQSLC